jgi:hypothetical protein
MTKNSNFADARARLARGQGLVLEAHGDVSGQSSTRNSDRSTKTPFLPKTRISRSRARGQRAVLRRPVPEILTPPTPNLRMRARGQRAINARRVVEI